MIGSHIIPKAYLEQFAIKKKARDETGRFFVYEKGKQPRRAAPKAEGVENGYFAFVRPDGSIDESLENSLAEFEYTAHELFPLLRHRCFCWDQQSRSVIALYAGLLFARSKAKRDASIDLYKKSCQELPQTFSDETLVKTLSERYSKAASRAVSVQEIHDAALNIAAKSEDWTEGKNAFLRSFVESGEHTAQVIFNKPWQFWDAPDGAEFITSDCPVATGLPAGQDHQELAPGFGFGYPGVRVFFPLNPRLCLAMGYRGHDRRTVSPNDVRRVNELIAGFAFQHIYSPVKSKAISELVNDFGSSVKFGKNAFLSADLPSAADVFRTRLL